MGVEPKIVGKPWKTTKMDGLFIMENPMKMDDLGGFPTPIFGNTQMYILFLHHVLYTHT